MAIATIDHAWIKIPLPVPRGLSGGPITHSTDAVCRVRTADGAEGIGAGRGVDPPLLCEILSEAVAPLAIGQHEDKVEENWQRLHDALLGETVLRPAKWTRRGVLCAIGMVDQALWDIRAKRMGVPLCEAIGGTRRPVPAYLSDVFYMDGEPLDRTIDQALTLMDRSGYSALKIRIGRGIDDSVERTRQVRDQIGPDAKLMVDANQVWELTTAVRAAQVLEPYDITWLEEPIKPHGGLYPTHSGHDANGDTGKLAEATSVPIATGENHIDFGECADVIERGGITYLQFDAVKNGGVTDWLRIAGFAESRGVRLAPHHAPHFHVQLASAMPNGDWVEAFDNAQQHPAWPELFNGFPPVVNGEMIPPDAPGWGMSINEELLRSHGTLVDWTS